MIRGLRQKFILVAMLSTFIVLAAIMGTVNISNYCKMVEHADGMTELLSGDDSPFEGQSEEDKQPPARKDDDNENRKKPSGDEQNRLSPETPFETRYFSVTVDEDGEILSSDLDNIAAVDEKTAEEYTETVLKSGKTTGFQDIYRYRAVKTEEGTEYIFLDCRREISNVRNTFITMILVSLAGLGAVFILVVIFSRIVFRPVEESIRKQKRFITDASHELKTPLTIIDANTEVMEMESGESQWTKSTRKQIQRLSALVQQLVTLTRLDEEKGLEEKAEFCFSDAVEDVMEPYEAPARLQGKNLRLDVDPGILYTGNEKSIRQLLGILMDNAMKYSTENGEIAVTLKKKGKKIHFEMFNEAEGLPEGRLDVLFERFYRLDSSRNSATGGSGIGLSVAQAIVQAHKGKITAENKDGKGLHIIITL